MRGPGPPWHRSRPLAGSLWRPGPDPWPFRKGASYLLLRGRGWRARARPRRAPKSRNPYFRAFLVFRGNRKSAGHPISTDFLADCPKRSAPANQPRALNFEPRFGPKPLPGRPPAASKIRRSEIVFPPMRIVTEFPNLPIFLGNKPESASRL